MTDAPPPSGAAGAAARPRRLLDRLRDAMRLRHRSDKTVRAYVYWARRYIHFHGKRHPAELTATDIAAFLTSLAVESGVSASTQNQALAALVFLYRHVLEVDVRALDGLVRAKRPKRLPTVLAPSEVATLLGALDGVFRLVGLLLYGSGLRLRECLELRIKDVDCKEAYSRSSTARADADVSCRSPCLRVPCSKHRWRR
jgi:site-specific recombinase XerD